MLKLTKKTDLDSMSISSMKILLKKYGSYHSLKNKKAYVERLANFQNILKFPWRLDQLKVLDSFLEFKHHTYVIQGVFGAGKTALLMGMLVQGIMSGLYEPEDCMFVSFNVSVRNEIKRKLKAYGISNKVVVRTFDSIVYEICKKGKYKYIDLPNFAGKRRFAFELCYETEDSKIFSLNPDNRKMVIFVDEVQDLELSTLVIMKHFYPNATFVLAGDIFQSIQKEPKESILWNYLMCKEKQKDPGVFKICFTETPRVPDGTLRTLKSAMTTYYPEFKKEINSWVSTNTLSTEDIEWRRFGNYSSIFTNLKEFLSNHLPSEVMIIVFSSSITVRGSMGDISRVRRYLAENGIKVNSNHKMMDPNEYFLTTAHSSKGLERDYVICFSTFPLEKAFIHLSDDVVVNLISVALSRAKKKVIMYVPTSTDKFSRAFTLFNKCPPPNPKEQKAVCQQDAKDKNSINHQPLDMYTFEDYINREHCVTELIRSSIVSYDTRLKLKEKTKAYQWSDVFENYTKVGVPIITDEERMFTGVLIENLITSSWSGFWPTVNISSEVKQNPMYSHIAKRLEKYAVTYLKFKNTHPFSSINQFQGIYLYTVVHVGLSNRIFMKLLDGTEKALRSYWEKLRPNVYKFKPKEPVIKIQAPVQMPLVNGNVDAMAVDTEKSETSLYELKASQDQNWKDDALLQVMIYALMTGKTWSRLHLINPFRNERVSYYFDTKQILGLRKEITNDVLIWNVNSFMAKTYPERANNPPLPIMDTLFVDIVRNDFGKVIEASILNMLSPIKCEVIFDKFVTLDQKKTKDMQREDKFRSEVKLTEKQLVQELKDILRSKVHSSKTVYSFSKDKVFTEIGININNISRKYKISQLEEVCTELGASQETTDKGYIESLKRNVLCMSFLFIKNKFVQM